jgi:hypothetical protein
MNTKIALLSSALAVTLYGCVGVTGGPRMSAVKLRPAPTSDAAAVSPGDLFYGDAVAAINRRDYARALDLLQAARDKSPGDVRVLNAFGVVYDKLGRFDLSQRYYAEAQKADPASAIVAQNLAYSKTLQGDTATVALAAAADPVTAAAPATVDRVAPSAIQAPLRQDRPVMVLAQAAAAGAAAATPAHPQPGRIVAPAPVATASEPFVVRVTNALGGASVTPLTLPELAPAAPASTPAPPPTEPNLVLAAAAAAAAAPMPHQAGLNNPAVRKSAAPAASTTPAVTKASASPALVPAHAVPPAAPAQRVATATKAMTPRLAIPAGKLVHVSTLSSAPAKVAPARVAAAPSRPVHVALQKTSAPVTPRAKSAPPRAHQFDQPRAVALLGRPLRIVYSGADRRPAEQLRAQLSHRGWTLALASQRAPAPRITTVRYDASNQRVALALARSLRIPVKLERCRIRCSGVTVLVGGQSILQTATHDTIRRSSKVS